MSGTASATESGSLIDKGSAIMLSVRRWGTDTIWLPRSTFIAERLGRPNFGRHDRGKTKQTLNYGSHTGRDCWHRWPALCASGGLWSDLPNSSFSFRLRSALENTESNIFWHFSTCGLFSVTPPRSSFEELSASQRFEYQIRQRLSKIIKALFSKRTQVIIRKYFQLQRMRFVTNQCQENLRAMQLFISQKNHFNKWVDGIPWHYVTILT